MSVSGSSVYPIYDFVTSGSLGFAFVVLSCECGGGLRRCHSLHPSTRCVGAFVKGGANDEAGFGLIGVWFAEILLSWDVLGPAKSRTILWIVFTLISVTTMSTMTPNMDLFGHLGGALSGFLMSILISDMREIDRHLLRGVSRKKLVAVFDECR